MTRAALGALLVTLLGAPPQPVPKPPPKPSAPIPALPVVTHIRIYAGKDATVGTQEITIARGDFASGDVDAFVAFGGPGVPRAFDVHLLAAESFGPDPVDAGEVVLTERAARRPTTAKLLLGRESSAGEVLHLREASLRRAFAKSGYAGVRVRSLLGPIAAEPGAGREVLVRLGSFAGVPLTLSKLEVTALDGKPLTAPTEAHLCGAEADPYPIWVQQGPAPLAYPRPTAPWLVTRHATDDLCVRVFLAT